MAAGADRPFYRLLIKIKPVPTIIGSAALAVIIFLLGAAVGLPTGEALVGALVGVGLHWGLEFIHHLGHAYAAKRAGYPMTGVLVGMLGILMMSLYPKDEPPLPGRVHIQRALGGPIASGIVGLIFLVLVLLTGEQTGVGVWLLRLGLLISVLMSVGALVPIPNIDGGTILYWLRRR